MRGYQRVLTIAGLLGVTTVCSAQQATDRDLSADADMVAATDVGDATCRDVLTLSGEEKDFVIVFLHGYVLGTTGATSYNTDALADITDAFLDSCIDRPEESALAVMRAEYN